MIKTFSENGFFRLVMYDENTGYAELSVDGMEDPDASIVLCEWNESVVVIDVGSGKKQYLTMTDGIIHIDGKTFKLTTQVIV